MLIKQAALQVCQSFHEMFSKQSDRVDQHRLYIYIPFRIRTCECSQYWRRFACLLSFPEQYYYVIDLQFMVYEEHGILHFRGAQKILTGFYNDGLWENIFEA